jgi:hypothetical protein
MVAGTAARRTSGIGEERMYPGVGKLGLTSLVDPHETFASEETMFDHHQRNGITLSRRSVKFEADLLRIPARKLAIASG